MKGLFLGEIVGRAGITSVKKSLKQDSFGKYDFCVANAEGAANGFGITREQASFLLNCGVDVLTGAEKIFFKRDVVDFISSSSKIIRPLNMTPQVTPGHGVKYIDVNQEKCAIVNMAGQQDIRMLAVTSLYSTLDWIIPKLKEQNIKQIYVIIHAQASAEKKCIFKYLDGSVTAVIGTHTKVMTADAQISEKGTAFITDNGRCGSFMSVGGLEVQTEIKKEKLGRVFYSKECFDCIELQGVEVESDENGRAIRIEPVKNKITLSDEEMNKFLSSDNKK